MADEPEAVKGDDTESLKRFAMQCLADIGKTVGELSDEEHDAYLDAIFSECARRSANRNPDPRDRELIPAVVSFAGLL